MKKLFLLTLITGLFLSLSSSAQQDKSKRPSPPAKVSKTLSSGTEISVDYSQPSLKGRSLSALAPVGKVWRTGANEATVFETSKDVKIEGKTLPAGNIVFTPSREIRNGLLFSIRLGSNGEQFTKTAKMPYV